MITLNNQTEVMYNRLLQVTNILILIYHKCVCHMLLTYLLT